MSRLDEIIADLYYILDSLRALKNIQEAGSCNECRESRNCEYVPSPGQQVRYNCPFFQKGVKL